MATIAREIYTAIVQRMCTHGCIKTVYNKEVFSMRKAADIFCAVTTTTLIEVVRSLE